MNSKLLFIPSSGAVIGVDNSTASKSYIEIRPSIKEDPKSNGVILLDDFLLGSTDNAIPKSALEDKHAVYLYGKTFTPAELSGTIYLGCKDTNDSNGEKSKTSINTVKKWFNENRVSKTKKPIKISLLNNNKYQVFIISLQFSNPDPKFNAVKFIIKGYTTPL